MKKHPIWYLIIGITILIIPTLIYLCFLIPRMSEEYNILMVSGGIISGGGLCGTNSIPDKIKFSGIYKLAGTSFTLLTVVTLVHKFIMQIVGLVGTFIACFIIFLFFKGAWKNARRRNETERIATEIAQNVNKVSE